MPPVATVSHLQYVAAGVPVRFRVDVLRESVPEHCWTSTYPGVLLLLVSNGLDIACPRFLVLQWYVVLLLRILWIELAPLR